MPAPFVWSAPSYMTPTATGQFATLPDGRLVAVWDSGLGVYRQIMNADGTPRGEALRIDGTNDPNQQRAKIAVLEDGRFVVTWNDTRFVNGVWTTDIKARILNADGSLAGDVFPVNLARIAGDQRNPSISALKGGGFVIGYEDGSGTVRDTIVQAFDRNGGRVGPEFAASNGTANMEQAPEVLGLKDGNYVYLYSDAGSTGTVIRGVIRTPEGQIAQGTAPFTVPSGGVGNNQSELSATLLADGRFVVVWASTQIPGPDTSGSGIYAQVFNPDGSRSGNQIPVNTTVDGHQGDPFVTALQNGGFAVAFEDGSDSLTDVHLRTFNSNGDPDSNDIAVHPQGTVNQYLAGLSCTKDGRIIVTWGEGSSGRTLGAIFDPRNDPQTWTGSSGDDQYYATAFRDTIKGEAGNDYLSGGNGEDWLAGGSGNDTLNGGDAADRLFGGAGADLFIGGSGDFDVADYSDAKGAVAIFLMDVLQNDGEAKGDTYQGIEAWIGSAFNDTIEAGIRAQEVWGDRGHDIINAGGGSTYLDGGSGNDTLIGGTGNDTINGGVGTNMAVFSGTRSQYTITRNVDGTVTVTGKDGIDELTKVRLLKFDDKVEALTNAAPTGLSLSGNTVLVENAPIGAGVGQLSATDADGDKLTYSLAPGSSSAFGIREVNGVTSLVVTGPLDFETQPTHQVTIQARDDYGGVTSLTVNITVTNAIETTPFTIWGTALADTLTGENGHDTIYGSSGNDQLYGALGNDRLHGGTGNDRLWGQGGKDVFVFDTRTNKSTNVDRVYDFKSADDSFYLDNKYYTKLGSGTLSRPKKFKSDMFTEGKKAKDAEDRIVYDKKTGALYYDQDGTGSKAQVKIATLTNKTKLYWHDFFVI